MNFYGVIKNRSFQCLKDLLIVLKEEERKTIKLKIIINIIYIKKRQNK